MEILSIWRSSIDMEIFYRFNWSHFIEGFKSLRARWINAPLLGPELLWRIKSEILKKITTIQQDHNNNNSSTKISPYSRFIYALNAPESKRQYPTRFQVFLDFLKLDGLTIEEKANKFYNLIVADNGGRREWLESQLIEFFTFQNSRAEKGEISAGTIKNYYKPVKLFCEMNNVLINWKFISRGIKKSSEIAEDRPPSLEEIKKLMEYPDRRMKPIVLTMISSGIRIGSWDYLKWKHIIPLQDKQNNNIIVAAKIIVYDTKNNKEYFSFITPEAYISLKEWMDFRASHGEKITGESWLMRNLWKIRSHRYANFIGSARHPIKFKSSGIRSMINDSWRIQGIIEQLTTGKRRHEFKSLHGFRKFFEPECQKVMKSLNVSYLMGHDTGITAHYYIPKIEELLDDYCRSIPYLLVNDEYKQSKQIHELKEKENYQTFVIEQKLKKTEQENEQMRQAMKIVLDKVEKFNTEVINNKEKETNPAKLKVKEFKDSVEKLENDLKQTKIMTTKLLEIYQKREEILSKKGFITREDQISIEDSVMDSIKESDPNLWKTLLQLYNNNNQN